MTDSGVCGAEGAGGGSDGVQDGKGRNEEVPQEEFDALKASFPFFSFHRSPNLTVGDCLLNIVFFHTVFETPRVGIFLQLIGFPMGTNCAPTWANLVLHCYERMHPV